MGRESVTEAGGRSGSPPDSSGEADPDERPPAEWATGGQPATERQVRVLEDHDVAVPEECTKARASQLITEHVYGGVEA